jgi:hypothetical protein
MSFRRFLFFFTLALVFVMAARLPLDSDLFWHLRAGEQTLADARPLTVDVFSHTRAGETWVNHSWLSQVWLYLTWKMGGWFALSLWTGALAAIGMGFIYLCMDDAPLLLRPFVIIFGALVAAPVWVARPQLTSLVLFAFLLWYLRRWQQGRRAPLWVLLPLFVLWSNLHGGYPLGLMLIGVVLGGALIERILGRDALPWARWRSLAVAGLLSWLVVAINPNTWHMWLIPFQTVGMTTLQQYISEWASPDFHDFSQQPFIWLLLGTMMAMGFSRRRTSGADALGVAMFAYLGLTARRNFGPFALITMPVLARHLGDVIGQILERLPKEMRTRLEAAAQTLNAEPARRESAFRVGVLILLWGVAIFKGYAVTLPVQVESALEENYPTAAVAWIQENQPPGNLFNEYNWGGYLIWDLRAYPVAVDGRTDLYGDEILTQYVQVQSAQDGWAHILDDWDVNLVLVSPNTPLTAALAESGWQQAYADEVATVWIR